MPINSCSVNGYTINSLLCRRQNLTPGPVNVTNKHPVQQYRYQNWSNREQCELDITNLESTNILLTLNINDKIIEKNFENSFDLSIPLIAISNINISINNPDIKISNLTIKRL